MKKRLNKIFEILWIVIFVLCLGGLIYTYVKYDKWIKEFIVMIPVSAFFYYTRRVRGKKIEEESE